MADDNDRAEKRREEGREDDNEIGSRDTGSRQRSVAGDAVPDKITLRLPVFRFSTKIRTHHCVSVPRAGLSLALVG